MKKLILLLLSAVGCTASTVNTCGLITAFGTQPSGTLVFYPVAGTYGTNIMTTQSQSVSFVNGCFSGLTLSGGNYEVDYYNRILLNIFVPFQDTNNWQLTDLATNLTSYVTFGQLGVFSNNVYAAALLAGQAASATAVLVLSNAFQNQWTASSNYLATNFSYFSTNLVNNTFYTNNTGKRAFVSLTESLGSTSSSQAWGALYVGSTTGGISWVATNVVQLANGNASGVVSYPQLVGMVAPNQVFVYSNSPTGVSGIMTTNSATWIGF